MFNLLIAIVSDEFTKFGEVSVVEGLLGRAEICAEAELYMRWGKLRGKNNPKYFPKYMHVLQQAEQTIDDDEVRMIIQSL
jgi:hypothetical protein